MKKKYEAPSVTPIEFSVIDDVASTRGIEFDPSTNTDDFIEEP